MNPKALFARARDARPGLDHLVRAYQRYSAAAGDRQAAAVTFFGFLSFFPLLALVVMLVLWPPWAADRDEPDRAPESP